MTGLSAFVVAPPSGVRPRLRRHIARVTAACTDSGHHSDMGLHLLESITLPHRIEALAWALLLTTRWQHLAA